MPVLRTSFTMAINAGAVTHAVDMRGRQRNNAFDYVRVFAFCGVVALHVVTPDGVFSTALNVLARFAVPFFFSLAGFFSHNISSRKLISRIVGTLKLCTIGVVLYGLTTLLSVTPSIDEFIDIDGISKIVGSFIVWNSYPTAYPLWFLFALLYVYCFALAAMKMKASPRDMLCLGVGLFVARFSLSELTQSIDPLGCEMRSWLFFGIPFFALGLFLRSHSMVLRKIKISQGLCLILIGCLLSFLECSVFGLQEVYLGTISIVVGCYIVCIKHPMTSLHSSRLTLALGGGKACLIAYLLHYAIIAGFTKALDSMGLSVEGLMPELILMLAVIIVSLGMGVAIRRLASFERLVLQGVKSRD